MGMGTVHPIVEQRVLRLALRLCFVAPADDIDGPRRMELVPEVTVHLSTVGPLVAHDEDLTTKPVHSIGVGQDRQQRH